MILLKSFWKLHVKIFNIVRVQIKKDFWKFVKLIPEIFKAYIKDMWTLIKYSTNYFDINFRRELQKAKQRENITKEFVKALKAIEWTDNLFHKGNVPRQAIRQFWNDFRKFETRRKQIVFDIIEFYHLEKYL